MQQIVFPKASISAFSLNFPMPSFPANLFYIPLGWIAEAWAQPPVVALFLSSSTYVVPSSDNVSTIFEP